MQSAFNSGKFVGRKCFHTIILSKEKKLKDNDTMNLIVAQEWVYLTLL